MKTVKDILDELVVCPNDDHKEVLGDKILTKFMEVLQFVKDEKKARKEFAGQLSVMAARFPDEDTLHQALEDADARIAIAEKMGLLVKEHILECDNAAKYHECHESCEVGELCSTLAEFYGKRNSCEHEWIRASNEKIDRFNFCPKCNSVMLGSI